MTKPNDTAERPLVSRIYAFGSERRGGVLFPFALISAVLFFSIGMAIDYSRLVSERERGQIALDAAVLGYVRQYINTQNKPNVTDYARGLADANDGSNLHWNWTFQDAVLSETEIQLTATGTATFSNTVMRIFGYDTVDLQVSSYARAYIPAVSVAIVPDISWTMRGQRLAALRGALKAFSTSIYQVDPIFADKLKVSLVPYADTVNVSNVPAAKRLAGNWEYKPNPARAINHRLYYENVVTADGARKHVETVNFPVIGDLTYRETSYVYSSGRWNFETVNFWSRPWNGCLQTKQSEFSSEAVPEDRSATPYIRAVVSGTWPFCPDSGSRLQVDLHSKATFDTAVDALTIAYGTSHDVGLLWAKRVLSPDWSSFFGLDSRPWNNAKEYPKYIVLLSDGQAAPMVEIADQTGRVDEVVVQNTQQLCSDIKSKGVTIMTVAYEMEPQGLELLNSCASPGYNYVASQSDVASVFQSIADKIKSKNLRIAGQTTVN
ncbi:MAG: pilus assembly protein TadG-related protein [Hyphomicrobiaceae bacterium]